MRRLFFSTSSARPPTLRGQGRGRGEERAQRRGASLAQAEAGKQQDRTGTKATRYCSVGGKSIVARKTLLQRQQIPVAAPASSRSRTMC
jgi:hypothetical protein